MSYLMATPQRASVQPAGFLFSGKKKCRCSQRRRGGGLGQDDVGILPTDTIDPTSIDLTGGSDSQLLDVLSSFNNANATPVFTNLPSVNVGPAPSLPASVNSGAASAGSNPLSSILKYLPSALTAGTQIAGAVSGKPATGIISSTAVPPPATGTSWLTGSSATFGGAPNWAVASVGLIGAVIVVKALTRRKK